MKTKTLADIEKLKEDDIWSLILFLLYKLQDIPELSSLSRLAYLLDRESILKLCEYFGGITLKIPTIEDLEIITYSLLLYQMVNIDGNDFNQAFEKISEKTDRYSDIKKAYLDIVDDLNNYCISIGELNV